MVYAFLMVGLPGSGKSTFAKQELSSNIKIFSSDRYREKLLGDASDQTGNKLVFDTLYQDMEDALRDGQSICLDATNVTRKERKKFLDFISSLLPVEEYCTIALVVPTPAEECITRDALRERSVGSEVILKFAQRYISPTVEEGFSLIANTEQLSEKEGLSLKICI